MKEALLHRKNPPTRKINVDYDIGEINETDLYEDKNIKNLVRLGRIPFIKFISDDQYYHSDDYAEVEIPPDGVSFGQKAIRTPEGKLEFYAGNRIIGVSKIIKVNTIFGRHIEGIVNKMLEYTGRAGIPAYDITEENS